MNGKNTWPKFIPATLFWWLTVDRIINQESPFNYFGAMWRCSYPNQSLGSSSKPCVSFVSNDAKMEEFDIKKLTIIVQISPKLFPNT